MEVKPLMKIKVFLLLVLVAVGLGLTVYGAFLLHAGFGMFICGLTLAASALFIEMDLLRNYGKFIYKNIK